MIRIIDQDQSSVVQYTSCKNRKFKVYILTSLERLEAERAAKAAAEKAAAEKAAAEEAAR